MRVAYVGNHRPEHSTETHVARAWENNGHTVDRIQEGDTSPRQAAQRAIDGGADLFMWTQTLDLARKFSREDRLAMLDTLRTAGIPTVGFHLDRWWGLERQRQVAVEPFFRCDLVVTADGDHDHEWARLGITHEWLPPAVSRGECELGTYRAEMASDVAFVGSWQGGYHPEWRHRGALVEFLRDTYGDCCRFWPKPGEHAVRGAPLRDLYASVKVLVGDSCLVPTTDGKPVAKYFSDRVPESIGRGGFLLHPWVDGFALHFPENAIATWTLGDWRALRSQVNDYFADDEARRTIAERGRAHVLEHHTYERRMVQVCGLLERRGLLVPAVGLIPGTPQLLDQ